MQKIAELKGHTSRFGSSSFYSLISQRVLHMARSPDGKTVASAAGDETLRFWKVFDYQEIKQRTREEGSPSFLKKGMQLR